MRMKSAGVVVFVVAGVLALGFLARRPARIDPVLPPPSLTLIYNAEEQPSEKTLVSQLLQDQLQKLGIAVTLEPVPSTVFNDRISKAQFQAALSLWYLDYDDPEGFLTDFYSKASFRMSKYANPAFDAAYEKGIFATTQAEKLKYFEDAVAILRQDLPWVPLFSNTELFLMQKAANGFRSNAYQYYDYRRVALETIRTASDVEVQTLDPAQAYDLASKHVVTQSYEGLVAMDGNCRIVPALATGWKESAVGDSITFELRADVKFHQAPFLGTAEERTVDAGDVKASFERLIKVNSPYNYIFDHVQGVDAFRAGQAPEVSGFVIESPLTIRVQLKRALPTLLPWLLAPAASVLPKELPQEYDFAKGSVGTGPFVLASWDGATATFKANRSYWLSEGDRDLPYADSLTLRVIKDANTQLLAFRRDELDIMSVPLSLYSAILDGAGKLKPEWGGSEYREVPLNNLKFIAFNMQGAPWGQEASLRRKVDAGLDRRVIVEQLLKGKGRTATSVIPQGVVGFDR